ncbi:MAG TPA: ABC transporter permease [Candidatus Limnocylindrales bacterium]|nr:ABC transporter permease [Candidatus Limnocylindrales bacterium]
MSRPAPLARSTAALASSELRLTLRRGENLLVTIVIPTVVLLFFATVGVLPGIAGRPVDFLLPGSLALAVIATGMVNLGIATGYDRQYGVLKRLGGAPVPRTSVIVAKVAAVIAIEVAQVVLLVGVAAIVLGWRPAATAQPLLLIAALLIGTAAFAGLGLLMAGTIRAEATLALANGLFLAFLMLGGIVIPIDHLPGPLADAARLLPAWALSESLRIALGSGADPALPLGVLGVWASGAIALAIWTFRWE